MQGKKAGGSPCEEKLSSKPFLLRRLLCCLTHLLSAGARKLRLPEWSYSGKEGPKEWAKLGRAYAECADGKTESPIDIEHATPADLPPLTLD